MYENTYLIIGVNAHQNVVMHPFTIENLNIHEALDVFRNMFPYLKPLGILKTTQLEATLMFSNFNAWNLNFQVFLSQNAVNPMIPSFSTINASGYTSVYLEKQPNQGVYPTLTKTRLFLGYLINAKYFELLKYSFHARNRIETNNFGNYPTIPNGFI